MAIINPNTKITWRTVWKPAGTARNTTAVLADDPHLLFPMLANKAYFIDLWVAFFTNNAAADFKYAISLPAGGNSRMISARSAIGGTLTDLALSAFPGSTVIDYVSASGNGFVHLTGTHENGVNAGNFAFQWAQNTSNAADVFVLAGSHIKYFQAD